MRRAGRDAVAELVVEIHLMDGRRALEGVVELQRIGRQGRRVHPQIIGERQARRVRSRTDAAADMQLAAGGRGDDRHGVCSTKSPALFRARRVRDRCR